MLEHKAVPETLRSAIGDVLAEARDYIAKGDTTAMLTFQPSMKPIIAQLDPHGLPRDYQSETAGSLAHEWRLALYPNGSRAPQHSLIPFHICVAILERALQSGYMAFRCEPTKSGDDNLAAEEQIIRLLTDLRDAQERLKNNFRAKPTRPPEPP